jgi:hypothetical protein
MFVYRNSSQGFYFCKMKHSKNTAHSFVSMEEEINSDVYFLFPYVLLCYIVTLINILCMLRNIRTVSKVTTL